MEERHPESGLQAPHGKDTHGRSVSKLHMAKINMEARVWGGGNRTLGPSSTWGKYTCRPILCRGYKYDSPYKPHHSTYVPILGWCSV